MAALPYKKKHSLRPHPASGYSLPSELETFAVLTQPPSKDLTLNPGIACPGVTDAVTQVLLNMSVSGSLDNDVVEQVMELESLDHHEDAIRLLYPLFDTLHALAPYNNTGAYTTVFYEKLEGYVRQAFY
jgi:hypothetical protein